MSSTIRKTVCSNSTWDEGLFGNGPVKTKVDRFTNQAGIVLRGSGHPNQLKATKACIISEIKKGSGGTTTRVPKELTQKRGNGMPVMGRKSCRQPILIRRHKPGFPNKFLAGDVPWPFRKNGRKVASSVSQDGQSTLK